MQNCVSFVEQSSVIDRCTRMEYGSDRGFNVNTDLETIIFGEEMHLNSFTVYRDDDIDKEQRFMNKMHEC
jgi:hypothetical protein